MYSMFSVYIMQKSITVICLLRVCALFCTVYYMCCSFLFLQEVFSAVRDRYMRDGEGFILVYSLTERATFTPISKISDQIKRVKDTEQHIPVVIVGNKVRTKVRHHC